MIAAAREYLAQPAHAFGDLRAFAKAKGLRYDGVSRAIGYLRDEAPST